MLNNEVDNIFKKKIEQLESYENFANWDKNSSWERLQRKKRHKYKFKLYYAAAILIIGMLMFNLYQYNFDSVAKYNSPDYKDSFVEYEKRQKLKEIEARMSGDYYSIKICFACDNIYYEVIKQDRPVKFTYFETFIN